MDNISNCLNQNLESLPSVGYAYLKDSRICRIIKSLIPYPHAAMCEFRQRTAAGWLSLAKIFALLLLLIAAASAQTYIITGSGTEFTATKDGETVGTADQPIQTVIDGIRTNANGADVAIQFGNGTTELNIGTTYISFSGSSTPAWGKITLSGKITGANTTTGTIYLTGAVSVESNADIKNTAAGTAVYNASTGAVSISGGTISATTGSAVRNSSGAISISGGTISATTGRAVYNASTGKITVSGTANITSANTSTTDGTIYLANSGTDTATRLEITGGTITNTAANGTAVYNVSTGAVSISGGAISATTGSAVSTSGKITVSGTANITSANTTTIEGTIYLRNSGTDTDTRLEITGGTITNTAANGNAVFNNGTGAISINGGKISATTGNAVFNVSTGAVSINGGEISATTTGNAVYNSSTGKITVSGTANITSANTTTTSGTIYLANSGTDTDTRLEITGGTITNTAANGTAVYNASTGAVSISGGTISATTGSAVRNSSGAISISGGTISATTGRAVYNNSTGKITVSGTANIRSATATTTEGTIYLANSGTDTDTRLEITGGTITNTAANGNAVYNASTGAVSIGGLLAITGRISVPAGNLSVITEGENIFAPAAKKYTLNLTGTQAAGNIAVTGGAAFMPNFSLVNANFYLKPNNDNIVLTNTPPVSVTNGTGSDYYAVGETVTITANTAPAGKTFKEWQISPAVTFTDGTSKTSPTAKFAMPAQAVTAEAIYGYVVTATSGTGGGTYAVGETVELSANEPPEGKYFHNWQITPEVTFLAGTSETDEEIEFSMPASNLTAVAVYGDLPFGHYAIEVETAGNGIANPSATSAPQGTEITLTVTPNAGYRFKEWQIISGGVTITDNKFTMPNAAVEIKAVFEAEPTPIVSNRIAAGSIMAQAIGKDIVLSNLPSNAKVEVFGLNGKRVGVQNFEPVHGTLRITVQTKGVYVVKAGGQSLRVVVK